MCHVTILNVNDCLREQQKPNKFLHLFIYVFTQTLHYGQYATQSRFLSRVQVVRIQ